MNAIERRVKTCRMINRMHEFPEFGKTLALKDQSKFPGKEMTRKEKLKKE